VPATDLMIKVRLEPKFLDGIEAVKRRDLAIYVGGFTAFALLGAVLLVVLRIRLRRIERD
jgi:hypothetical protein